MLTRRQALLGVLLAPLVKPVVAMLPEKWSHAKVYGVEGEVWACLNHYGSPCNQLFLSGDNVPDGWRRKHSMYGDFLILRGPNA